MAGLASCPAQRLDVPPSTTGKRSRSNSTCSSSSSASSADCNSIFSRINSAASEDCLSSYSSPSSSKSSPASSASDEERPSKTLRTGPEVRTLAEEEITLSTLEKKCSLQSKKEPTPPPQLASPATNGGKSLFVDCLVDATVHVLDMIWHAPVRKSISFFNNVRSASSISAGEIIRPCKCPVGAPLTGGIPLDLFIRETLRRSRTSCSTLQAALLYCKRVGAEVLRKRAELEGVALTQQEETILQGGKRAYPSLAKSSNDEDHHGAVVDPILCSRRTFLAAIMVSSKFLQDRTFSNRAWSKISGLNVKELGLVERRMLDAIEFDLYVGDAEWQSWTHYLRGEWKTNLESCQCHGVNDHHSESVPTRKAFERTQSLQVEDVMDMEVPQSDTDSSSVTTHSPMSTPNTAASSDSCLSTPTQTSRSIAAQTPTKNFTHKRESSLLATAVNNSVFGNMRASHLPLSGQTETSVLPAVIGHEMPLPYPLRKGLVIRSFSAQ